MPILRDGSATSQGGPRVASASEVCRQAGARRGRTADAEQPAVWPGFYCRPFAQTSSHHARWTAQNIFASVHVSLGESVSSRLNVLEEW